MDRGLQAAQKRIKMAFKPYFSVVSVEKQKNKLKNSTANYTIR